MTFQPIKSALDKLNVYPDDWQDQPVGIEPNEPRPPEMHYERKWIVLLAMPNREQKSFEYLDKRGLLSFTTPYWPHVVKQVHVRGRRQLEDRARSIFPGLLFVSIALGNIRGYQPFREIETTPGIRGYLRNGRGHVLYASDKDMRDIERIEVNQNCPADLHDKCLPKAEDLRVGQEVKAMVDLVNERRTGTISKRYHDGSYDVDIPGLFSFGRVTTMRLFANQVEAM